ncbi:hypothetical protein LPU83_pLPU83d_1887 (plasmid) [Rhizobium favelukesii]|uniref:Uncharacterized protein n=1 Tax=Rhizobium favelukesii TaxID=348824 RepID=W6RQD8_9HYPH|nr:hypothetical protein LPU83_pLPU83d_1887 [Rhizobium favelukesii]
MIRRFSFVSGNIVAVLNVYRTHQFAHRPEALDKVAAVNGGAGKLELLIFACRLLPMVAAATLRPPFGFPEPISALIDPVVLIA